jgi:hypothetical protein
MKAPTRFVYLSSAFLRFWSLLEFRRINNLCALTPPSVRSPPHTFRAGHSEPLLSITGLLERN